MAQDLHILKTYKIYIGGEFPRTESGRYYKIFNAKKNLIANACLCTRKDLRNAVVAARKALDGWSKRPAFNRGQILYRIAEMLEGRKTQFVDELMLYGYSKNQAIREVQASIDTVVYYSGWCDKYQQIFSTVNPVASSHFNFSVPEPTGVVAVITPNNLPLLGAIATIMPPIVGGNCCVVLASEHMPLCAITFAEVLATSDLPHGVVNILTGKSNELHTHMASHMDINAIITARDNAAENKTVAELAAQNIKRSYTWDLDWTKEESRNPYLILNTQEIKTTWHPIQKTGVGSGKY